MSAYTIGKPAGELPFLGSAREIVADMFDFAISNAERGDIVPFHFMGAPMLQVNHPDLVKYVLIDNHKNYNKGDLYIQFESALGKALLTSDGEKWRRDRQTIQPMFRREIVEGYYFEVMRDVVIARKRKWQELTKSGAATVNMDWEMASLTLEIALKCIFGKEIISDAEVVEIYEHYTIVFYHIRDIRLLPQVDFHKIFHTPAHRRFINSLNFIRQKLTTLATRYRDHPTNQPFNLLELLWVAQKNKPEFFSEKEVLEHLLGTLFAGFESTSVVLRWMWFVLDQRPDITLLLREEIKKLGNRERYTPEDMPLTIAAFEETMRLYPPFWMTGRGTMADDTIGGVKVTRKTPIWLPQIAIHRDPRFWKNPNAFVPDRFLGKTDENLHPGVFFPFSQGPRKCAGIKFAEQEVAIIFYHLLPHFSIRIPHAVVHQPEPKISLGFKKPLYAVIDIVNP